MFISYYVKHQTVHFSRWQTETGGVAISPRPSEVGGSIVPGKPMRPLFGIQPVLMDEKVTMKFSG